MRIARDQGCPGDQIPVRHFIEQVVGVVQAAALDVGVEKGVEDGKVVVELGSEDVSMDNGGLFTLARLATFVEQLTVQGPVSFQRSAINQIKNMEPCPRLGQAVAEKVLVLDDPVLAFRVTRQVSSR